MGNKTRPWVRFIVRLCSYCHTLGKEGQSSAMVKKQSNRGNSACSELDVLEAFHTRPLFFLFFFAFFVALLGLLNGHQPWQHGRSLNSVERVRVSRANATEPVSLGPPCNLLHTFYQTSFSTRPVRRDTPGFWPTRRLNGAGCRGCHRCQFNACTVQPRYWPMEVLLCRPFTSYKGTASKKHQNMQNSAAKSF